MADSEPTTGRPFLRWVGSKYRLLDQIAPYIPSKFNRYFEPFLGSGALFFHLKPDKAFLSDTNSGPTISNLTPPHRQLPWMGGMAASLIV